MPLGWAGVVIMGSNKGKLGLGTYSTSQMIHALGTALWSVKAGVKAQIGSWDMIPGGREFEGIPFLHSFAFYSAEQQWQLQLHHWLELIRNGHGIWHF